MKPALMATPFLLFLLLPLLSSAAPRKLILVRQQPLVLSYHNGPLLKGDLTLHLLWYGNFTPSQRAVISDFILSLSSTSKAVSSPSAASWWATTARYRSGPTRLLLGRQLLDEACSLGKTLTSADLLTLAGRAIKAGPASAAVVLTSADVAVDGFCSGRCGTHGSTAAWGSRSTYVWVGDSAAQCPGQCAWPFHQPLYGPQAPPLAAPSGDVGADGMVINLAGLLAGAVTNPYGSGFFQGPREAPLEAVSACAGAFGSGAYPGYPGKLLVEPATGASYNAKGVAGRKFLLPAMWDPKTSQCATLV